MLSCFAPKTEFDAPLAVYSFLRSPLTFAAQRMYKLICVLRPQPTTSPNPIRVVCISDTHSQIKDIPDGQLLIHAGDLTNSGTVRELQAQIDWLHSLPHRRKIAIGGNHDTYLDDISRRTLAEGEKSARLDWRGVIYLQHTGIELVFPENANRRLVVYGAPQIPACGGPEFAFQYPRSRDVWDSTIPKETDILVTHTPPRWHLDLPSGLGCEWLLSESWRVQPKLHVFGHVHAGYGSEAVWWNECQAAYERICARDDGTWSNLVRPLNWIDLARVMWYGTRDIIWSTLWGGETYGGMLVNSALMSQETGVLDHAPQVIDI